MTTPRNTQGLSFGRKEKLKSRKRIDYLFEAGNKVKRFPVLMVYVARKEGEVGEIAVSFSVSKRRFRRAVDRNRVKRRMREAYRLNKHEFASVAQQAGVSFDVMFTFIGREMPVYSVLHEKISGLPERWKSALQSQTEQRSAEHERPKTQD